MDNDGDAAFPKLGAPARRALSAAGYTRLDQLARVSERDLKKLELCAQLAARKIDAQRAREFEKTSANWALLP